MGEWILLLFLLATLASAVNGEIILDADFSTNIDGFQYKKDYFQTNHPSLSTGHRTVDNDAGGILTIDLGATSSDSQLVSGAWVWIYRQFQVLHVQLSFQYRVEIQEGTGSSNTAVDVLINLGYQEVLLESVEGISTNAADWKRGYVVFRDVTDFERHRLALGARAFSSAKVTVQFTDVLVTSVPTNRHATLTDFAEGQIRFPLRECEGPCTSHADCAGDLLCLVDRDVEDEVPGCLGQAMNHMAYCYEENLVLAGDNNKPSSAYPLNECEGDCDKDEDCSDGLVCFHRRNQEEVPGCTGLGERRKDYCYRESLIQQGDNGKPASAFPLGECMGDCDKDSDCAGELVCRQRQGHESIPGCPGIGGRKVDYCYRESLQTLPRHERQSRPLEICQGSCDSDDDCSGFLKCFQRFRTEQIPGCPGIGEHGKNYCFDDGSVLNIAPPSNTSASLADLSYFPGKLKANLFDQQGRRVRASIGLSGRAIAYSGKQVEFTGSYSGFSSRKFHGKPDAAACFPNTRTGGHFYSSNSELRGGNGGVGVIEMDASGEVIGYFRTLNGTSGNCGGGKTEWGSWVSCEENGKYGHVWQTDPRGIIQPQRTALVPDGGNYESFAYSIRGGRPEFFVTEDNAKGPLVRFQPDEAAMRCFNSSIPEDRWCTLNSGTHSFLRLSRGACRSGRFYWDSTKNGQGANYPFAEGIDCRPGVCYFVSKKEKCLYILDLENMTYEASSTVSGAFNRQPDQVKALVDDPMELVYFCEDGGNDCGVHARDSAGRFFSILDGPGYRTETTGLAFSPDRRFMTPGTIWQLWRTDGRPFTATYLDIKYHAV